LIFPETVSTRTGRKQLPHEIPHWIGNPSFESYFVTIGARDRESGPLIPGETAGQLLQSIRFYEEKAKWRTDLALIMPDHVHLLTTFPTALAPIVRAWKRWTARTSASSGSGIFLTIACKEMRSWMRWFSIF